MNERFAAPVHAPAWLPGPLHGPWVEIAGNLRLRLALWVMLAIVWVWPLLLLKEHAQAWRTETQALQDEILRYRPLRAGDLWVARAEEAHRHLEAARAMLWAASSQGLAEAELQDTLRSWAGKAGLPIREISVAPVSEGAVVVGQAAGARMLRAKLVVDVPSRLALMGLLAELQRSPKVMVVDTLRFRAQAVPAPRAEMEVRVLFRPLERAP